MNTNLLTKQHKNYLVMTVLYLVPLTGMGVDLYSPSLPAITTDLHTTHTLVKLTISMYFLGYALCQPFFGTLSDSYGRRKLLLGGMIFYVMASFIATLSTDIYLLLAMRFLQGLAIAAPSVITKSLVTDVFSGHARTKVLTSFSIAWGLGPIVAPAIGGYLQHYIGWQANFAALTVYGFIGLLLTLKFIPETRIERTPLNVASIISNYATIVKSRLFIGSVICMAVGYSLIILFNVIGPFLIQVKLHYSAVDFGHIALFMGMAFFLGNVCNRLLVSKLSGNVLILMGLIGAIVFSTVLLLLGIFDYFNLTVITVPIFLVLFSSGFVLPNCLAKALSLFPHIAGSASAIMGLLFILGTAASTVVASFLKSTSQTPMAITYVILAAAGLLAFWLLLREKN